MTILAPEAAASRNAAIARAWAWIHDPTSVLLDTETTDVGWRRGRGAVALTTTPRTEP